MHCEKFILMKVWLRVRAWPGLRATTGQHGMSVYLCVCACMCVCVCPHGTLHSYNWTPACTVFVMLQLVSSHTVCMPSSVAAVLVLETRSCVRLSHDVTLH